MSVSNSPNLCISILDSNSINVIEDVITTLIEDKSPKNAPVSANPTIDISNIYTIAPQTPNNAELVSNLPDPIQNILPEPEYPRIAPSTPTSAAGLLNVTSQQNVSVLNQDIDCWVETFIDKLESELEVFASQTIPIPTVPTFGNTGGNIGGDTSVIITPISTPVSFDYLYTIPIIVQLTSDINWPTGYYNYVHKLVSQTAIDDINGYIRNLIIQVRTNIKGPSIYFNTKFYDINAAITTASNTTTTTATTTTTTTTITTTNANDVIETAIISLLRQIVLDLKSNPSTPQQFGTGTGISTLLNVVVGLNNNIFLTPTVLNFIKTNNLIAMSTGAGSPLLNQDPNKIDDPNSNIFRLTVNDEEQIDIFTNNYNSIFFPTGPIKNLIILYKTNTNASTPTTNLQYGSRLANRLKLGIPAGVTVWSQSYTTNSNGQVVEPQSILTTVVQNSLLATATNSNTAFYVIGENSGELADIMTAVDSVNNTQRKIDSSTGIISNSILYGSQWYGSDLTFNIPRMSINNLDQSLNDSGVISILVKNKFTWIFRVAPSQQYAPPIDISLFDPSHVSGEPNNPDGPNNPNNFIDPVTGLTNIDSGASQISRFQLFNDQVYFAYHREWAQNRLLFDRRILQNVPDTLRSSVREWDLINLPLFSYALYDSIFLTVLGYNNSKNKTVTDIINQIKYESHLYIGFNGWINFNSQGFLPESYYECRTSTGTTGTTGASTGTTGTTALTGTTGATGITLTQTALTGTTSTTSVVPTLVTTSKWYHTIPEHGIVTLINVDPNQI
jgi:hypothetical protein